MSREIRIASNATLELREGEGEAPVIAGYASVFYRKDNPGTEYILMPGVKERVASAAFNRSLAEAPDILGLFNHSRDWVLGRTAAGTVTVDVDDVGLRYEIKAADRQIDRDVLTSIRRGDVRGSSFAFYPRKVTWLTDGDWDVRYIEDADLVDVGPVTDPAYTATTTGVRAIGTLNDVKEELAAWREQRAAEREAEDSRRKLFAFRARARLRS